jgi:beta-aspartyl-peptidase (threonine type)
VGDTPLVGCGFYADDNAAISCTGHGEDFMRLMVAKRAADFVARGASARDAAEATIALISAKAQGTGGLIIVDRLGNVGFSWNSQHMARAYMCQDMQEPIAGV